MNWSKEKEAGIIILPLNFVIYHPLKAKIGSRSPAHRELPTIGRDLSGRCMATPMRQDRRFLSSADKRILINDVSSLFTDFMPSLAQGDN
jgi:hypothetical protein